MTKIQVPITKQKFDLEERTLEFSKKVVNLLRRLSRNVVNFELTSQTIRSVGSIGANYREANDALSRKDFFMRLRIARKEAKETKYWLELLLHSNPQLTSSINPLLDESIELIKIFSSIIKKDI